MRLIIAFILVILKFSRRQFKSAVNSMAYDQGFEPVYYEED